jgi:hypothetical protein
MTRHRQFGFIPVVAAVAAVLALALVAYWPRVGLYVLMRDSPAQRASLSVVPIPLESNDISQDAGTQISIGGIAFEAPWTTVEKERRLESVLSTHFAAGFVVAVFHPDKAVDPVEIIRQQATGHEELLRVTFGEELLSSPFDFYRVMLNQTPSNLTPFMPFQRARGTLVVLTWKTLEFGTGIDRVYSLNGNGWHGFQFGDPMRNPRVRLLLFDKQHRIYELWVGKKEEGTPARFTQAHVNRILATLNFSSDE